MVSISFGDTGALGAGGLRDRLVHAYDDINHDIVFTIVKDELPALIAELDQLAGEATE